MPDTGGVRGREATYEFILVPPEARRAVGATPHSLPTRGPQPAWVCPAPPALPSRRPPGSNLEGLIRVRKTVRGRGERQTLNGKNLSRSGSREVREAEPAERRAPGRAGDAGRPRVGARRRPRRAEGAAGGRGRGGAGRGAHGGAAARPSR